jgi:hypothetical protein
MKGWMDELVALALSVTGAHAGHLLLPAAFGA